jgi:hypothetical protein
MTTLRDKAAGVLGARLNSLEREGWKVVRFKLAPGQPFYELEMVGPLPGAKAKQMQERGVMLVRKPRQRTEDTMPKKNQGKFNSDLDRLIYEVSLDGGPDEETGSASEAPFLWAGIMRNGDEIAEAILREDPKADVSDLRGTAGVIFTENDQGFVEVYHFDDAEELNKTWQETIEDLTLPDDELESNPKPRPTDGYGFETTAPQPLRVDDEEWDIVMITRSELPGARFVGTRSIDDASVYVWKLRDGRHIAQSTRAAR